MKQYLTIALILLTTTLFAQSTSWNEYKLKEHWKTNGADEIEGIYENTVSEGSLSPKYTLGLVKTSIGYSLIYCKVIGDIFDIENGRKVSNKWRWSAGDVKAYLTPTATPFLFKTKWYIGDKSISENLYITFESGLMKIIWTDGSPQHLYIKLYPTANDNIIQSGNQSKLSSGTGFGISSNGIIVTNYHVIDGAKSIKVRGVNSDFNKTYNAKVLVSDKNNDLALIQIDDYGFTSLGTVPYTIKTGLVGVGENIFVLGYPLRATMGDEIKLTNGIVSSRTGFQGDITSYQISAPVQPGNSGGPLFDSQGNLIGIINAKHGGAENASYAVKTSYLTNLIDLLPSPPKLQTVNSLSGKTLTQQVELGKKFVYIIETE
jgi:S1-C subfamily serine protease